MVDGRITKHKSEFRIALIRHLRKPRFCGGLWAISPVGLTPMPEVRIRSVKAANAFDGPQGRHQDSAKI